MREKNKGKEHLTNAGDVNTPNDLANLKLAVLSAGIFGRKAAMAAYNDAVIATLENGIKELEEDMSEPFPPAKKAQGNTSKRNDKS